MLLLLPLAVVAQNRVANDYSQNDRLRVSAGKRVNNSGLRTTAYDGVHHLLGLHVDGGYSAMFGNMPAMTTGPGGYTTGFGLDYSYTGRGLILQTGLGIRWQDVRNRFGADSLIVDPATDSEGVNFRLKYDFTDRIDRTRNIYVQLPVLAGMYFYNFYFLAGLKLNFQVAGWTQQHVAVSTSASYDRYIGIWEEMDNHGIRKEVEQDRDGAALNLKFDVMGTFEIGYEWAFGNYGKKGYRKQNAQDYRLRLAAFVECGFLDIMPDGKNKSFIIPDDTPYDFSTFGFNHMLSTTDAAKYHARNVFTGLRLSFFFFGYQSSEKCILCGPLGDEIKLR
ncbi:MAG: hypothetical protein J5612_02390 [Paludibacteraceae bacterium]|nr:hypothetical protein [Paludibacteraceae bacterium]